MEYRIRELERRVLGRLMCGMGRYAVFVVQLIQE